MSTIKINELATSSISLSDFFAKADANGLMTKNTFQNLGTFLETVGSVSFRGSLAIADTPNLDGWYFASESGTYTNAGSLVVDISDNLVIIVVSDTQTTFEKIDIPVSITFDSIPTPDSANAVTSNGIIDLFANDIQQVLGEVDATKGDNVYSQKGLGIKTNLSPTSGTYKFNAIDNLYLGTLREKSDILVRVYTGNFSGTQPKTPSSFTRLSKVVGGDTVYAEKVVKNIPVGDSKPFRIVFDEIFEFTSAGSIDFLTVFMVAVDDNGDGTYTQNGKNILLPYHTVQNSGGTRSGMYFTLASSSVDFFTESYSFTSGFLTNALNFVIVPEEVVEENPKPTITIPNVVKVMVGETLRLYYDSIVEGVSNGVTGLLNYKVDAVSSLGSTSGVKGFQDYLEIKPTSTAINNTEIRIDVYNDYNEVLNTKIFTLNVISATAPSVAKVVNVVGDSTNDFTQPSYTTQQLKDTLDNLGGTTVQFVGGKTINQNSKDYFNEAIGGYSTTTFTEESATAGGGYGNKLWNAGALDIANYRVATCGLASGTKIDIVVISLGINDAISLITNSFKIPSIALVNGVIDNFKELADAYLADNASCKVLINLPLLCGNTDGGFATNYGTITTRQRYEKAIFLLRKAILDAFDDGAYNPNVKVVAGGIAVNRWYGYARTTQSLGGRYTDTVEYHNNAVHPKEEGSREQSDGISAYVLDEINS